MIASTFTRRPLAHILAPLMLVGTIGALGATHAEASSAGHPSHTTVNSAGRGVRLTISSGTTADYRAREQLAFFSFPTDAVGVTSAVKGSIALDTHGRVVSSQSKFVIDLRTLKSDRSQRDQFIQSNTLQTSQYPDAVFTIDRAVGLPSSLPTSGAIHFTLVGKLTVHGVTQSTIWTVTATLGSHVVTGVATTHVKLTSFGMSPPQVGPVLSVNDSITLEIKARLTRMAV